MADKNTKINSRSKKSKDRLYWGKNFTNLPLLDLIAVQKDSYEIFLREGIGDLLSEIVPVEDFTGKNWSLDFGEHFFEKPRYTPQECLEKGLTYDTPLKAEAILTNKQTGREIRQEVFLGDVPAMTDNGTFIINGVERCIVSQIVRSPGVYFTGDVDPATGKTLYIAEVRPLYGSWLDFSISRNDVITVRIDRRRKYPVTTLLRAIGIVSDE